MVIEPLTMLEVHESEQLMLDWTGEDIPLNAVVSGWRLFVHGIELRSEQTLSGYQEALVMRDLMQRLIDEGGEVLSAWIGDAIADLDERFKTITRPATGPLAAKDAPAPPQTYWWRHRLPSAPADLLAGEMREMGWLPQGSGV